MRAIQKGKEPDSLVGHRCAPAASYANYADKDGLRVSLVDEQRGICCYCMSRIFPDEARMKIEHWQCQTRHPDKELDYSNLLGACLGNQGEPWKLQHCDTRKGDDDLSKNPANPTHRVDHLLHYLVDGVIRSDSPGFDRELNEVLNLNVGILRNNRKAVLDGFLEGLPKKRELRSAELRRWMRDWNGDAGGELRPFCQVVVYWLAKRLKRST